jgi:hypothetical protein
MLLGFLDPSVWVALLAFAAKNVYLFEHGELFE